MINTFGIIAISVISGFALGVLEGWIAGKKRTRRLLSYLYNNMEKLRLESKLKVSRRDIAAHYKDKKRANELTTELSGESTIFYAVKSAICDWCVANNEQDPFKS